MANKNLLDLIGDLKSGDLRSGNIELIDGMCGSKIQLLIDLSKENFPYFELLRGFLAPKKVGNPIQYKIGGEVIHIFTSGTGEVHRADSNGSPLSSVKVEINSSCPWHFVVVPPCGSYQVINKGDKPLEYWWIFVCPEDAYDKKQVEVLSGKEATDKGFKSSNNN